jgi:hypothetical protein
VKYVIILELSAAQLQASVNDRLRMGWTLHGTFVFCPADHYFYQAMVKT